MQCRCITLLLVDGDDGADLEAIAEYHETHELTEDEIMSAEPGEPVAAESVMITTSLRLPKPVMDEVRRRARERGLKPVPLSVITAAVAEYQHRRAS